MLVDKLDKKGLNALYGTKPSYYRLCNTIILPRRFYDETALHEVGHFVDDVICKKDDENISHSSITRRIYNVDYVKRVFKKEFGFFSRRSYKMMCLQDLMFILSNGKYRSKYTRPIESLQDDRTFKTEIFANLFSIKIMANKKHIQFIHDYFPQLWEEFDFIIRRFEMKEISKLKQLVGLENKDFRISIHEKHKDGWVIDKKTSEPDMYIGPDFFKKESDYGDVLRTKYGFNVKIVRE